MKKAIFLDRDGVINRERGTYTYKPDEFELVTGLPGNLKRLQKEGYILIIISNQSGIAKGIYGHEDVLACHDKLTGLVAQAGVTFEAFYYCPHHPDYSKCLCRKPGSLLLEKAIARFRIDPSVSFLIGDRQRDIEAAEKAGVKGILTEANRDIGDIVRQITTNNARRANDVSAANQ